MDMSSQRCLNVIGLSIVAALFAGQTTAFADKVGVAAAVKPDASSGGQPINIGNSIFYNERINTSGTGLVQVLLVDGSTFTVGPDSHLVIDKFVYNPNTKSGQIVATFGKGVMRFVGGKISKNEGGVTVNTPSGALAIRGGMMFGRNDIHGELYAFLYGDEMIFRRNNGETSRAFAYGTAIEVNRFGGLDSRPVRPEEVATFMRAFSRSGGVYSLGAKADNAKGQQKNAGKATHDAASTIFEATQTQVISEILSQLPGPTEPVVQPNPPPPLPPPPPPPDACDLLCRLLRYEYGVAGQNIPGDFPSPTIPTNSGPTQIPGLPDLGSGQGTLPGLPGLGSSQGSGEVAGSPTVGSSLSGRDGISNTLPNLGASPGLNGGFPIQPQNRPDVRAISDTLRASLNTMPRPDITNPWTAGAGHLNAADFIGGGAR
jgi:hypothetical protein